MWLRSGRAIATLVVYAVLAFGGIGCGDTRTWSVVDQKLPGALFSVWGTSATDVWAVGADIGDGKGPMVVHYDGAAWRRLATGQSGDLWWVHGFAGGAVYLGGAGGMILRYQGGAFTRMSTPGTDVVFGIWGASPSDVWAVGGAAGGAQGAFAWRLAGDAWTAAPGLPAALANEALWKVYGRGGDDVWMVGTNGNVVRWDGSAFALSAAGSRESLFTVHANQRGFVAVGGFGTGLILENEGRGWVSVAPRETQSLVGVCVSDTDGYAVGQFGAVYRRGGSGWAEEITGLAVQETLHAVWIDPSGGVWAVGGQVLVNPPINGVMLHKGATVPGGIK